VIRRVAALLAVAGLAACSSGDDSTLGRAEEAMAGVDAGTMSLELAATAADVADPVGFRDDGSFSFASEGDLPVFDFEYTELLAGEENVATITSDGKAVTVVVDGDEHELSADDARSLRLGDDEGFADLGIASWVDEPSERQRGDDTIVTGGVDAADLLSDIARIAAQVNGSGEVGPLEGDAAERLAGLVRSSEIEVVIGDDDVPRSVEAVLDFGADVPDELTEALGPYAAAQLRLTVTLEPQR
jgi:hypothetical protein